ncbi:MAG: prepilin-type N-terminal cleavage/methylation domain-containing protein [Candidatus Microsaccharimonas sp.]
MLNRPRTRGFTIVELIIVIVVIAVLAAIISVAYNGITNQAKDVSLANDVKNAGERLQLEELDGGTVPTSLPGTYALSDDSILTLTNHAGYTTEDSFCISGYSPSTAEIYSYRPKFGGVRAGLCPTEKRGTAIGGTFPEPIFGVNVSAGFRDWKVTSGTGVKFNGSRTEAKLSTGVSGTIRSPLYKVTGSTSITLRLISSSTVASSYFDAQSRSGVHTGAGYLASNKTTTVVNSIGNSTNGNAQSTTLNQESAYTTNFPTGPNVHFAYLTINSSTYTSDNTIKEIEIIIND